MPEQRRWAIVAGLAYVAVLSVALAVRFHPVAMLEAVEIADSYHWPYGWRGQVDALFTGSLVIVLLDLVLAWALWRVFAVRRGLALVMAAARAVYALGHAAALIFLLDAVWATLDIVDAGTLKTAREGAEAHRAILDLARNALGLHLVLLGALLWSDKILARTLAGLTALAGAGYFIAVLTPQIVPALLAAQLPLAIWLLTKAGRSAPN